MKFKEILATIDFSVKFIFDEAEMCELLMQSKVECP